MEGDACGSCSEEVAKIRKTREIIDFLVDDGDFDVLES